MYFFPSWKTKNQNVSFQDPKTTKGKKMITNFHHKYILKSLNNPEYPKDERNMTDETNYLVLATCVLVIQHHVG